MIDSLRTTQFGRRLADRVDRAHQSSVLSGAVVVYLFVASVMWATLTPLGDVHDEPAHFTYAAGVVRGDLGAIGVVNHPSYPQLAIVTVPEWIGSITDPARSTENFSYPCYVTRPEQTADCAPRLSTVTTPTGIPTTATRYPPPFYAIIGLPTLIIDGAPALYSSRILAAALAIGAIALGLAAASPKRRGWLALATAVAATPTVARYAGSANPSGLEIAAVLGLGVALMGADGQQRTRPLMPAALVTVLAFTVAWARPNGHLVLFAVLAACLAVNGRELLRWLRSVPTVLTVGAGVSLAVLTVRLYARFFTRLDPVLTGPEAAIRLSSSEDIGRQLTFHRIEERFADWGFDTIGTFGWSDHVAPDLVGLGWAMLAIATIVLGYWVGTRRDRIAIALVAAGSLLITPYFITTRFVNANEYQARYQVSVATLIIVAAVVAVARSDRSEARDRAWSLLRSGSLTLPIAMCLAIASSIGRYSVGNQAQIGDLLRFPFADHAWLPPTAALIAAMFGAIAMIVTARIWYRVASQQPMDTEGLDQSR